MYEYHNNILSIPARLLYEDLGLMTYEAYKKLCVRKKLIRTKEGRGRGNEAFVAFKSLPDDIKKICIQKMGDPKKVVVRNQLLDYLIPDHAAINFFAQHRKPDGKPLTPTQQREKVTNCIILNAIQTVFENKRKKVKMFGKMKTKIWKNISEAVNGIPVFDEKADYSEGWLFSLPGNENRLKKKYYEYLEDGYKTFIHKGEGTENSLKIKGEIADFILATYQLANKPTIPDVHKAYELERHRNNWSSLTEQAINRWLNETEQKRIWIVARDGKDAWRRNFGNSIERNKENWFPNIYWAIDGSKLDLVYYDPESSNKMGAKQKINVCFDIYSEKIIGYSLSETENHIDHIKAVNMALQEAQVRPYLFTYDNQSGHKMNRMQDLYNNIVAKKGGTHYPHKVGQKSNPIEQFFNRLQQDVISKLWHSDKQSIKARALRNQMNEEFIKEQKENLPTKAEIPKIWELCVKTWNEKPHPLFKTKSRNEVYKEVMPMQEPISLLDIVSTVWIAETKKQTTYRREGITLRIGDNRHRYEVYTDKGEIDTEFRRVNIGKKFIIRYNPEYLNDYVQLYEQIDKELLFITCAEPKRTHESIPVLMKEDAKKQWWKDFQTQEEEYQRDRKASQEIANRAGITRRTLIEDQELTLKMGGQMTKKQRNLVENIFDDL